MLFALLASAVLLVLRPALRSLHGAWIPLSWPAPKTLPNSMPGWKGHARHGYSNGRHRNARPSLHSALRPPPERGTQDLQLYTPLALDKGDIARATTEPQRGISVLPHLRDARGRVQTTIPQGYDRSPAGDAIEATPTESSIPHSTIYRKSKTPFYGGRARRSGFASSSKCGACGFCVQE